MEFCRGLGAYRERVAPADALTHYPVRGSLTRILHEPRR